MIAIIGVLMGLLLPAVQSAREAGRRATCANNQYQMAVAAIRFDQANGFVPGWRNPSPNPADTTVVASSGTYARPTTWTVPILTFMERRDIVQNWSNLNIQRPFVNNFVCPSSPPDSMTGQPLSYAGNMAGQFPNVSGTLQNPAEGVMLDVVPRWNGTRLVRTSQTFDDISNNDGTGTTLLFSEKCGPVVIANTTSSPIVWDLGWTGLTGTSSVSHGVAWTSHPVIGICPFGSPPSKTINSGTWSLPGAQSQPSSQHPGGAVVAFCDGHTAFLKDSLAPRVYAQLMTSNNGSAPTFITGTTSTEWGTGTYILNDGDYN